MEMPSLRRLVQDGLTADHAVQIASIGWEIASQGGPHSWFFLFVNRSMGPLLDEVGPVDADAAEAVLKQLQSAILKGLDCVSHSDLTGLIAAAKRDDQFYRRLSSALIVIPAGVAWGGHQ